MFRWIVEDPSYVYFLLGVAALVCAVQWWLSRSHRVAIGFGVALALMVLVALLDHFIVTDNEQIVNTIRAMAEAAPRQDVDAVFAHVSEDFNAAGMDKNQFRKLVVALKTNYTLHEFLVWDLERTDVSPSQKLVTTDVSRSQKEAIMTFLFKAKGDFGDGGEHFRCTCEFVLDKDGKWRMKSFKVTNPVVNVDEPLPLPSF